MNRFIALGLLLVAAAWVAPVHAADNCDTTNDNPDQTVGQLGNGVSYHGVCDADNEVIITTGDVSRYKACWILSTTGAVDVYVSLDGTNYGTTPISVIDMTDTAYTRLAMTTQGAPAAFELGGIRNIKVLAAGAAATVTLNCFQ